MFVKTILTCRGKVQVTAIECVNVEGLGYYALNVKTAHNNKLRGLRMKKEYKHKVVPCCMSNLHGVICGCDDSKSSLSAGVMPRGWAEETMMLINKMTPNIEGKAFDPDWFLLRQRLEEAESIMTSKGA